MIEITDKKRFTSIVEAAREAAFRNSRTDEAARRLDKAIERAVGLIESQPEWLTYFADTGELLVWSQDSNQSYTAGHDKCECKAYLEHHQVCKHRVLVRLLQNYFESEKAVETPKLSDYGDKPYLKTSSDKKPERLGNVRF